MTIKQIPFDPTVNDWLIRIGQLREAERHIWNHDFVSIDTKKVAPAALAASLREEAKYLAKRVEDMGEHVNERWRNAKGGRCLTKS